MRKNLPVARVVDKSGYNHLQMTPPEKMRVTSIGHIANQVLRRNPFGLVTGTTSQGIYLQPSGDLTLFLSNDRFRGPLTLNIRGALGGITSIQPGMIADLAEDTISFKYTQQVIRFQRPLIWNPPSPPGPKKIILDRFTRIFHQTQTIHSQHPYLPLLEIVTTGEPVLMNDFPGIGEWISHLTRTLATGDSDAITYEMSLILGAGPGLTPLGDDLLLGILLAITRTQWQTYWSGDVIHHYHALINTAEEKTTRLSWSLLNCAIQGTADERIIRVLDGLIAAREIPDHDLESLLNWGSSSGIAVLAGMIMALS